MTPDIAANRADLIRRLYPVSITTGFAAVLGRTLFSGVAPGGHSIVLGDSLLQNWRLLTVLLVSVITVLASWDGYQAAIARTPLVDRRRFYLDISIVFIQLLLLQAADLWSIWFALFALLYGTYVVWDVFRQLVMRRMVADRTTDPVSLEYGNGSIAISVFWFVLALLLAIGRQTETATGFTLSFLAALAITVLYRVDKRNRLSVGVARALLGRS